MTRPCREIGGHCGCRRADLAGDAATATDPLTYTERIEARSQAGERREGGLELGFEFELGILVSASTGLLAHQQLPNGSPGMRGALFVPDRGTGNTYANHGFFSKTDI